MPRQLYSLEAEIRCQEPSPADSLSLDRTLAERQPCLGFRIASRQYNFHVRQAVNDLSLEYFKLSSMRQSNP